MSAAIVDRVGVGSVLGGPSVGDRCGAVPSRTRGRSNRPATATHRGPIARPLVRSVDRRGQRPSGVAAPGVVRRSRTAPASAPLGWRLTDRGLAVVLGLGLVLVAIALGVVISTAITVTDENYRPTAAHQAR